MTLTTQFYTMIAMIGMGSFLGAALDTYNFFFKKMGSKKVGCFFKRFSILGGSRTFNFLCSIVCKSRGIKILCIFSTFMRFCRLSKPPTERIHDLFADYDKNRCFYIPIFCKNRFTASYQSY